MGDRSKYLYPKTIKGKAYLFFRYKGALTPLPIDQDSAEFRCVYDRALRSTRLSPAAPTVVKGRRFQPNTLNAAIDVYLDSAAYDRLAATTKAQYLHTLKQMRPRIGEGRMLDLDEDAVEIYVDQLAKEHGTSVADRHLRLLSKIWKVCRKFPQFNLKGRHNPTVDVATQYTVQRRHRPWPRHVQEAFMAGAPAHMKLAKLLLHFSAQRGGDCVRMLWAEYDGRGITVRPRKTRGDAEAVANYHICPKPLREALDAVPRIAPTILVNAFGKPYADANILSHAFKRELVRLGLAKDGERSFVMHGLRKTAAADVGSLGVGAGGIKSITGHRTDAEANYYAKDADTRRVNAQVVEQWDRELERQEREAEAQARRARLKAVS